MLQLNQRKKTLEWYIVYFLSSILFYRLIRLDYAWNYGKKTKFKDRELTCKTWRTIINNLYSLLFFSARDREVRETCIRTSRNRKWLVDTDYDHFVSYGSIYREF